MKRIHRHARRRASQRYDFHLDQNSHYEIIKLIKHHNKDSAKFLEKQSNRVSIWEVNYKGRTFKVAYDRIRKQLITFLPNKDD